MSTPSTHDEASKVRRPGRGSIHRGGKKSIGFLNPYADHGGTILGLDGLRAFAVLAVIVYHVGPDTFRGGFLGVDVFFVISGFLITTLLLREDRRNNYINLKAFWVRRVRRLIPAFVVLILVVVPLAWAVNTDLLVGIRRQVLGALTFSTNWLEISVGSSYFDSTAPILLKNFWSLAIEEQFYLFWPLIMVVLLALAPRWRTRTVVSGSLALLSAGLMFVLFTGENLTRLYYGTDTHLFGLAIGITLAFLWADERAEVLGSETWVRSAQIAGLTSFGVLLLLVRFLPDESILAYRGGMFAASLLTVVVLASMLQPGSLIVRVFEIAPLRWLGTRSYGIYLWHWPVIVLATAAVPAAVGSSAAWLRGLIAVTIACLLAEVSYRWIETPIRVLGVKAAVAQGEKVIRQRIWQVVAGIVALLVLLTAIALIIAPKQTSTATAIQAAEDEATTTINDTDTRDGEDGTFGDEGATAAARSGVAPPPETLPEDFNIATPVPEEITAIGDSMISASKTGLEYAMPGINVIGKSSTQWPGALEMIEQAIDSGNARRGIVLAFGTNAGVRDSNDVRRVLNELGPDRMILLVNLYSPSSFINASNEQLAQIADEYPNVKLMDWHAVAADNPGLLQVDQTHTSIEGANAFGQLVVDTFKEFSAQLAAEMEKSE